MRLLHTTRLELHTFMSGAVPDYVILSHRWGREEVTFKDLTENLMFNQASQARVPCGFSKIQGACKQAVGDGYDWIWIDSCCIDRSSSSELQEAINSMWNFYARSNICYAYLVDVPDRNAGQDHRFNQSEWFTRGWTLQELIAPECVEFYAADWSQISTKAERHKEIAYITHIDPEILARERNVEAFSAAERLSWAAHRNVTREEDVAYSLMGLFQVNMPMLYGEGGGRAFMRLQEAVYTSTLDHTLFFYRYSLHQREQPLLADSPIRFCPRDNCSLCRLSPTKSLPPTISYTNIVARSIWSVQPHDQIFTTFTTHRNEVSVNLELLDYNDVSDKLKFLDVHKPRKSASHIAILNHTLKDHEDGALCLLLFQSLDSNGDAFLRVRAYPVLLPLIQNYVGQLEKRKILICPGPVSPDRELLVDATFVLTSPFNLSWTAKHASDQRVVNHAEKQTTEFSIRTTRFVKKLRRAQISNLITISENPFLQVSLQLVQFDETWSIKEAVEIKSGKPLRNSSIKFRSSIFSDRIRIRLTDGKMLSVGLRRLAACSRPEDHSSIPQFRYKIILEYA